MPTKKIEKEKIELLCDEVIDSIKQLRESKNITTAKLSEMTGIAQPNITRMEVSVLEGKYPNLKTVATIAIALGARIIIEI